MLDLTPYGAFIENTVRPLFEELHILFKELESCGMRLDKQDISKIIEKVGLSHLQSTFIQYFFLTIICAIICLTLWMIYR